MVNGMPRIEQVLPRFVEFVGQAESLLMAHNAGFDVGFLSVAFSRSQLKAPSHPVLDFCSLARQRCSLPNYKLQTLGRHYELCDQERHRAVEDAQLLREVFLRLIDHPPRIAGAGELFQLVEPLRFDAFGVTLESLPPEFGDLWHAIQEGHAIFIEYWGGSSPGARRAVIPKGLTQVRGKFT